MVMYEKSKEFFNSFNGIFDINSSTREKAIAANRSGLTKIFIPIDNEKDIEDIPNEVRNVLEIKPVSNIKQILEEVFA